MQYAMTHFFKTMSVTILPPYPHNIALFIQQVINIIFILHFLFWTML